MHVSPKTLQNCFPQNFVVSNNFDNFWHKDGKEDHVKCTHFPHHLKRRFSDCCTLTGVVAAVPDLSLDLATTNYLGPALQWTLIGHDVSRAIAIATTTCSTAPTATATTHTPLQTNLLHATSTAQRRPTVQLQYYGTAVCQFILAECHELGLWTGSYADNCRQSHGFRDRCALM